MWTIQAGMFPENTASIKLHERVGFEIVGRRKRLGKLNGEWRDVLLHGAKQRPGRLVVAAPGR